MLTGHHPFRYLPAYIELSSHRAIAEKAGIELSFNETIPYIVNCHYEDYYLLKLPEVIDVNCLNLL